MKLPLVLLAALFTTSHLFASQAPSEAIVLKTNESRVEITTSSRTNGCKLELRRLTRKSKSIKEYWSQSLFCGDDKLLELVHKDGTHGREISLLHLPNEKYQILQLDSDLDGDYDMILVLKAAGLDLVDVLVFEKEGYLRHGSKEEFEARIAIMNQNNQGMEELHKITQETFKKFNDQPLPQTVPAKQP